MNDDLKITEPRLHVCICVATYKRPKGLARLLDGLQELRFERTPAPRIEVVVVDNDPGEAETRDIVDVPSALPIVHVVEPRRGISFARNAAVRATRAREADLMAFIDDDEVPDPDWMDELIRVMENEEADVVTGPVLPLFEVEPPKWIVRGRFFDLPRYSTGETLDRAYTNNVLFRVSVLDGFPGPFNEERALSGGEDVELFLEIARAGYRIVWADGAIVREWNPASRLSASWILKRAFRVGNTWGTLRPGLQPSFQIATREFAKGVLLFLPSLVRGRHAIITALRLMMRGMGYLAGKTGFRLEEYRRTHGA
ncbi:glycosyltransferase [Gemmatimonadota bacterium]